jgi:hypothetical protein
VGRWVDCTNSLIKANTHYLAVGDNCGTNRNLTNISSTHRLFVRYTHPHLMLQLRSVAHNQALSYPMVAKPTF